MVIEPKSIPSNNPYFDSAERKSQMLTHLRESHLKGLKLTLVAVIWLFAFWQLFSSLNAIRSTRFDDHGVVVVSSRSKVEDIEAIAASMGSPKVLYLTESSEFGKHVMSTLGRSQAKISYYSAQKYVPNKLISEADGAKKVREISTAAEQAKGFPTIPILIAFTIGVGLFFTAPPRLTSSILAGASVLAIMKSIDACPTCPKVLILGTDAGLLGFAWMLALALSVYVVKVPKIIIPLLLFGCASISLWQLVAVQSNQMQCSYCSVIALMVSFALASLSCDLEPKPQTRKLLWSLTPVLVGSSIAAILHFQQGDLSTKEPKALTGLGVHKPVIRNISELGIESNQKKRILYVAAAGCPSCEEGLTTILALAGDRVELWFVDAAPPKRGKNWHKIVRQQKVSETPIILFVNQQGTVENQITGYSSDARWVQNLSEKIEKFLPPGK